CTSYYSGVKCIRKICRVWRKYHYLQKVSQGYNAVLGAKVQAIINCPDGTTAFLDLNDNGSAPDVRKSDGVYTRYFSSFVGNGQYTVSVNVTGTAADPAVIAPSIVSPVQYNFGYINSADVVVLNPNGDNTQGQPLPALVQFSRISDAGGFTYSGPIVTTYNDIYAPAKVLDLGAIQVDPLDGLKGIVFSFTSPGDDEDQGTASEYELRYLFDNFDTLSTSFENAFQVDQGMITSGDLMQPKTAGTAESITVFLPNIPADKDNVVIGFAIRAKDDVDNTAAPSNIAVINLFIKPPAIGCIDDYGYPYSGEPFKKPDDCDDFYQCSNGELSMIHCQPGTVFNPVIKVCDHPAMVPECQ
uniref:chitinase n=1 Tax=Ciona savignyi TaxID=51511 RepID=H2ZKL9_CIOSA